MAHRTYVESDDHSTWLIVSLHVNRCRICASDVRGLLRTVADGLGATYLQRFHVSDHQAVIDCHSEQISIRGPDTEPIALLVQL